MEYQRLDLSELSCYVAGEIDNYILKRNKGFDATKELVYRMKRFSEKKLIEIDPPEGLIYHGLLKNNENIKTVKDLQLRISELVQELNSIKTLPKKRLESLRTLCLNLSDQAVAYEDYSPRHLVA